MGRFGDLSLGGPVIKIWRITDREGEQLAHAGDQKLLLRDTFFALGNGEFVRENFDEAIAYYQRARRVDPDFPEVGVFLASAYLRLNRYQDAADEIRLALSLGSDIGQWERIVFFRRDQDGESYAQMGAVCAMVGYYKEAALIYERGRQMGYETVDVLNNMGVIYHALARYEEAAAVLPVFTLQEPFEGVHA